MAPKKNKKGNKLARMNDEEKLRYLQHRAAVEEETRRRKEQLVATYLKNKLKKEEAFTRLNTAKLNQQWRHNLRKFKCKELKDEMMTMENRFEVLLECKNNHIDMLLKDLEDAEEQNLKQYRAHVEIVSQFLSLHKRALEELYARYDDKKKSLLDGLKHTIGRTREVFARDSQRLGLVSAIFESRDDDDAQRTHVDFEDSVVLLDNETLFEKDRFARTRLAEMRTTVSELRKVLDDYGEETDCKRSHYNYLKARDEANAAAIGQNDERIREYSEEIETLTRRRADSEAQYERRENDLRSERDELAKRYLASRDRLDSDRNAYRKKLEAMTGTCKTVTDKLSSVVDEGERILKTADSCAKLSCDDDDDDDDDATTIVSDEDDGREPDGDMWKFWKRCARAQMQCRQLDAKRAKLSRENDDLKAALAYYLKTVARPASVQRDMADGGIQLNLLPVKAD